MKKTLSAIAQNLFVSLAFTVSIKSIASCKVKCDGCTSPTRPRLVCVTRMF